MALAHRHARAGLHHSDRGVQYTSAAYQQLLAAAGFTPSMSRIGNCWDSAVGESFFATLTKELLVDGIFATRAEASRSVFEFIARSGAIVNDDIQHSAIAPRWSTKQR
jgi:transposase InsO family protein